MRYGRPDPFYLRAPWKNKRKEVLKKHRNECQYCKAKGRYTRATHVHHDFHRDKYPEYELDEYVTLPDGTVKKNLIPCCKECHETEAHPERLRWNVKEQLNEERW